MFLNKNIIILSLVVARIFCTEEPNTGEEGTPDELDYNMAYEEIYDRLELDSVESILASNGLSASISIRDIVDGIARGDGAYVARTITAGAKTVLVGELIYNKTLMLQLVLIVMLGSIFVNISGSFGKGFISENGFYVTYLIITSIMLTSFTLTLEVVSSSIEKVLALIQIIVPVYSLIMNFVGHVSTSAGMYQITMVGVWLVQVVILRFIIPMIKFYVIISLVNNLNKEDSFSKLCRLIRNMVSWMLRTIIVFVAGLNIIKSLIDPQLDAIGRNAVSKVIATMPGGGVMSVLTGTFLGAGRIIKNSVGIGGIILLLAVIMVPVVKTFIMMFAVRLTAVMVQPIGEKRYVDGIDALAQGMSLLLKTILSSVVLFMLTIAIMAYASGGG